MPDVTGPTGYLTDSTPAVGATSMNIDGGTVQIDTGMLFTIAGDTLVHVAQNSVKGDNKILEFLPALTAAPGDNAVITFTDHVFNFGFHRDGLGLVSRPLASANPGEPGQFSSLGDEMTGMALRLEVTREHKQTLYSLDALWGVAPVRDAFLVGLLG